MHQQNRNDDYTPICTHTHVLELKQNENNKCKQIFCQRFCKFWLNHEQRTKRHWHSLTLNKTLFATSSISSSQFNVFSVMFCIDGYGAL